MSIHTRKIFSMVLIAIPVFISLSGFTFIVHGKSSADGALEVEARRPNEPNVKSLKAFDWVDTSSPRGTMNSFLMGTQRYYDLIREDGYTRDNWRELTNIITQAERLFDLRMVPSGHRRDVAHETTALIREAIARVPLPKLGEIPDEDKMAARVMAGKSAVYRVPDTPFEIARTESGPDTGRYQFTQKTVDQARDFYEEIGLRSTKIPTRSGHQINIPNQELAKLDIENIGRRPFIRRKFNITITYDTPPEKIARALELLREILAVPEVRETEPDASTTRDGTARKSHPNEKINQVNFPPLVYFSDLNVDSLNLLVYYLYHPPEYWDYLEHATWINMQIIERFNAEGIDFAFPTQTLHLAGDDKRSLAVDLKGGSRDQTFQEDTK